MGKENKEELRTTMTSPIYFLAVFFLFSPHTYALNIAYQMLQFKFDQNDMILIEDTRL